MVALNPDHENIVIATPDVSKGYVKVNNYEKNKSIRIPAHQASIFAMALNF